MNEKHLDRYAQILVQHALGLRPGQRLDVWGELIHRPFGLRIGEAAYDAGAGQVIYHWVDPLETAQLLRRASPAQIARHFLEDRNWYAEALCAGGALLCLVGKSDPTALAELQKLHPETHQSLTAESNAVSLELTRRIVEQRLCPATSAPCPTPTWARRVFPELSEQAACERFWQLVFGWTGADQDDGTAVAEASFCERQTRARALDALAIRELHVVGGGNDFRVGITALGRWQSGVHTTISGQRFFFNFPAFEIFTTPERHRTEGRLVAARPLRLPGGVMIENLVLEFQTGHVVAWSATSGSDTFARWLDADDGARYLGEIALVDAGSPIARAERSFEHALLDENAAAHAALGQSFANTLEGGPAMTPSELEAAGCNRSSIHLDIAFGSAEVDVIATRSARGEVMLLERGRWVV